jgi:hypothetical protein
MFFQRDEDEAMSATKLTAKSPRVLKMLRRFEARKSLPDIDALGACFDLGLLKNLGTGDSQNCQWEITDAGRRALSEGDA